MGSEGLEHHRRCGIEAAQGLTGVEVAAALRVVVAVESRASGPRGSIRCGSAEVEGGQGD